MITTVTLNVAIDRSYVVDNFNKGEVIRVLKCTKTPGGKGLNVARVIKLCGESVLATGFIGGHSGAFVKDRLNDENISHDFLHTASETRICINVLDREGTSTEFLEPGETIRDNELEGFLKKFESIVDETDVVTISGSAPKGISPDIYSKLIKLVKNKGKKVILDTSGQLLIEGIKACPTMIKPNRDEIKGLFEISNDSIYELAEGAKKLNSMGIEIVVVSLGSKGAIVVTNNSVYHGRPPNITPVNTVGAGDSMVAAFAVGLTRNYSVEEMLRYAIAVSAANTLTMTTGHFNEEDRKALQDKIIITKF